MGASSSPLRETRDRPSPARQRTRPRLSAVTDKNPAYESQKHPFRAVSVSPCRDAGSGRRQERPNANTRARAPDALERGPSPSTKGHVRFTRCSPVEPTVRTYESERNNHTDPTHPGPGLVPGPSLTNRSAGSIAEGERPPQDPPSRRRSAPRGPTVVAPARTERRTASLRRSASTSDSAGSDRPARPRRSQSGADPSGSPPPPDGSGCDETGRAHPLPVRSAATWCSLCSMNMAFVNATQSGSASRTHVCTVPRIPVPRREVTRWPVTPMFG